MKTVIAIAFSDLHCNLWSKFNDNKKRTLDHFRVLSLVIRACKKHNVKDALFCGDFFHKPENLDSELLDILSSELLGVLEKNPNINIHGISGNHDMKFNNRVDKPSPSLFHSLCKLMPNMDCVDFKQFNIGKHHVVYGVPYLDRNLGLNEYLANIELNKDKKNILLLHTDYPGAKDNDGSVVDSVENLNINMLHKFDLVLIGHIHKPQRLSKKVYMVGATHQQRRTDRDSELGYLLIYDDLSTKHISIADRLPKFIDVNSQEEVKEDGNYYTVVGQNMVTKHTEETRGIDINLSRKRIARQYLKSVGVTDPNKKKLLLSTLKNTNND